MDQRFSLEAAGKLFGISTNAMRARAKNNPDRYQLERDNSGKIWLWIDPENLPAPKVRKEKGEGSTLAELKASIDSLKERTEAVVEIERLKAENGQLRERLAATEADRDRWQAMAEKLADRPGWWAQLWRRK